ncbi:synaptobrevin family [Cryptosporidium sp. chipmunk genotype I]|uniref:synaptobrevin family n=1 Tax=Cryptosporidium sp. chipmunk genotype I TaxID=1280935 RepID=UPI00351A1B92|nr:synaptobrevin family [Cryptosporidium sp. chipmunk genotype I]
MLALKSFPTRNKNLIFTGIGSINKGIIIFSWFDRISSLLKDKINEIFVDELKNNNNVQIPSPRIDKIVKFEEIEWKLYIWIPPLDKGKIAYSVCCKNEKYPEKLIYSYLRELNKSTLRIERISENIPNKINELNGIKNFKEDVKNLVTKFDDFENFDKIAQLEGSAGEITSTIQDNIQILLNNKGILQALDGQAEALEDETESFLQDSVKVKNKFWWKNMKYTLVLACLVSLIFIIAFANLFNTIFGNGISLLSLLKSNSIASKGYSSVDNNNNIILAL